VTTLRKYAWSFAAALLLTVLLGVVASLRKWSAVGILLAPGMLIAAIGFPQGIHSNWAYTYLVIAGLANALVLAWPIFWWWTALERFHGRSK
jgi:hypothetical protein